MARPIYRCSQCGALLSSAKAVEYHILNRPSCFSYQLPPNRKAATRG